MQCVPKDLPPDERPAALKERAKGAMSAISAAPSNYGEKMPLSPSYHAPSAPLETADARCKEVSRIDYLFLPCEDD